jgi:hypothetical protein
MQHGGALAWPYFLRIQSLWNPPQELRPRFRAARDVLYAVVHGRAADGRERGGGGQNHALREGGCHDEGVAEWIVTRGPLRGQNHTPIGQPTPGRLIGHPGVFGVLS